MARPSVCHDAGLVSLVKMLDLHINYEKFVAFILGDLRVSYSGDDTVRGKGVKLLANSIVMPVVNIESMVVIGE